MIVKNLRVWEFNIERIGGILPKPKFFLVINLGLQFVAGLALIVDYGSSVAAIVPNIITEGGTQTREFVTSS